MTMGFTLDRRALLTGILAMGLCACEKQIEPTERTHAAAVEIKPADPPPHSVPAKDGPQRLGDSEAAGPTGSATELAANSDTVLALTGLTMTVPTGWVRDPVEPRPMAPKAAFRIPDTGGHLEDCIVRVSHYPAMKGKDELNIRRWIGQVARPDGSRATRDDATVTVTESGDVRLTVVDVTGSVRLTMRAEPTPNRRLIAAIVDHPQGPHFVRVSGDVQSMEQARPAIDAFLGSATTK